MVYTIVRRGILVSALLASIDIIDIKTGGEGVSILPLTPRTVAAPEPH